MTPEELLWIQRRLELAKSIYHRPSTNNNYANEFSAIGVPPMAAAPVPPAAIPIHNMTPMSPLVMSAAPMLMVPNPLYQPHPNNNGQPFHQHQQPHPHPSAVIMPYAHGTNAIPNTLGSPQSSMASYRQTSGGGYNNFPLAPPPTAGVTHTQLSLPGRISAPEDELAKKISQRIQEKLNRLNKNNITTDVQQPPPLMHVPHENTFQSSAQDHSMRANLSINNTRGERHAAGFESVTKKAVPIDATTQFEQRTADFERRAEFAVGLIRKRMDAIVARDSVLRIPAVRSKFAPDTGIPTTLNTLDNARGTNLDTKQPTKRKRDREETNFEKITAELNNFMENSLDDENIRCSLNEDKANKDKKRDEMNEVYKKCIKDVESRLEMYTQLESLAEQMKIKASRMTTEAVKKRNTIELDWQLRGAYDTIRLHLHNYRMLEDEMDRILGIEQEK